MQNGKVKARNDLIYRLSIILSSSSSAEIIIMILPMSCLTGFMASERSIKPLLFFHFTPLDYLISYYLSFNPEYLSKGKIHFTTVE